MNHHGFTTGRTFFITNTLCIAQSLIHTHTHLYFINGMKGFHSSLICCFLCRELHKHKSSSLLGGFICYYGNLPNLHNLTHYKYNMSDKQNYLTSPNCLKYSSILSFSISVGTPPQKILQVFKFFNCCSLYCSGGTAFLASI